MDNNTIINIKNHIINSNEIFIMAHKKTDLDAFASLLGLYEIVCFFGKSCYILLEESGIDPTIEKSIIFLKENGIHLKFYTYEEVKNIITNNSLLFIVDVSKKELLEYPEVITSIDKRIILDHHVVDERVINNNIVTYIDDNYSSTSEIIVKLINNYEIKIDSYIATIMLGGIIVDTNNFTLKTNANTYYTAAILTKWGADNRKVQHLLKNDLEEYFNIQKNISNVLIMNNNIGICICDEKIYDREFLAKISSTILSFDHIEISFCVGYVEENVVGISCRSIGDIDANNFMNKLGGGGHHTDAAVQIMDRTKEEVKEKLLREIREVLLK